MQNNEKFVLWLLGPTSSGKTTIANHFKNVLKDEEVPVIHYDGDEVRNFFGSDLGFSKLERLKVVKTLVHLSNKATEAGLNVVVSALTANPDARDYVIKNVKNLIVGYLQCSIEVCMQRDPKGLYRKAQRGDIDTLIGFNNIYMAPKNPDIVLDTERCSPAMIVVEVKRFICQLGYLI